MDHPLIDLINARIDKAERDGAFDNLPGAGAPLPADDGCDPMTRVLKTNGAVPEAVALLRQLEGLRTALRDTSDRTERTRLIRDIALLETRLDTVKR